MSHASEYHAHSLWYSGTVSQSSCTWISSPQCLQETVDHFDIVLPSLSPAADQLTLGYIRLMKGFLLKTSFFVTSILTLGVVALLGFRDDVAHSRPYIYLGIPRIPQVPENQLYSYNELTPVVAMPRTHLPRSVAIGTRSFGITPEKPPL